MDSKQKQYDVWDHSTQKMNYDIYRPKYPEEFFQKILDLLPSEKRVNYLDIATGTGALIFPLSSHFSNISLGIDSSGSQIATALKKVEDFKLKNLQFNMMDVLEVPNFIAKNQISKFDLITIGQALHWFDIPVVLKMIKNELLNENGILSVLSYACLGYEYNVKDQTKANLGYQRYQEWYEIIEKYFDCDRGALMKGFEGSPFKEIFGNMEKDEKIYKNETTDVDFVKYLKTYSAYNCYCDKNSKNAGYKDPILKLEEEIKKDLANFDANEFYDLEKPLKCVTVFFQISMKN